MRSLSRFRWLVAAGTVGAVILTLAAGVTPRRSALAADASGRPISYLKEVRPILAQHCFRCHGPDEAARKGKLRLDLKDAAFAARAGKHVIVPGRLADSLVWERITNPDDGERMPPVGSTEPLTAKQI